MNANFYTMLGLNQPWAITPEYAQAYLPLLAQLLKGETPSFEDQEKENSRERLKNKTFFISSEEDYYDDEERNYNMDEAPAGGIAVLNLNGPVMEHSQWCGPKGTTELAAELRSIEADGNLIGTILKMDSGGGQSYAVKVLTDVMSRDNRTKPIVVLGGNCIASAAYGIAVFADEIVVFHPRAIIGCIGTVYPIQNFQPALEKLGVQFHEILATKSPLKNNQTREALKGNYTPIRENWIDYLNEDFHDDVTRERPQISNDSRILDGENFVATNALALKMIDYIGDMDFAISRVKELSAIMTKNKSVTKPQNNMKIDKIKALAGIEAPSAEQLDLANAELTAAGITHVTLVSESLISEAAAVTADRDVLKAANTNLNTQLGEATSAKTTAESLLADANTKISGLEAKVEAFGKNAGASHVPAGSGDTPADEDDDETEKALAAMPHNIAADKEGY